MNSRDPVAMMRKEMRVAFGPAPHSLDGLTVRPDSWLLSGETFLLRHGQDHWFHYRKGEGVTVDRGAGSDPGEEAFWLNGSVYSAAAAINGLLPFHASAVCHEGRVYAFTGPSGAGKSTLATALAAHGLPLFCDDTLVLDMDDPRGAICLPGHKRLKLADDAIALTGAEREEAVAADIPKYYATPPQIYEGVPLPLAMLVHLEEGEAVALDPIVGAERIQRLDDDHYTSAFYAAACGDDLARRFAHWSKLAMVDMRRFVRPLDPAQFAEGVVLLRDAIVRHGAERDMDGP